MSMPRSTRTLRSHNSNDGEKPPVALGGEVVFEPGLPHSWVAYSCHYGMFHTFADSEQGPWMLCSCAKPALATVAELTLRDQNGGTTESLAERMGLPAKHLPVPDPWNYLDDESSGVDSDAHFVWADGACHRCNVVTPSLRWAHEMYETQFNQFHGWYTAQAMARAGFMRFQWGHAQHASRDLVALRDRVEPWSSEEPIRPLVMLPGADVEGFTRTVEERNRRLQDALARRDPEEVKRWRRIFQDEARTEFGYRKVGEGFVAETQLASLVEEVVGSGAEMIRHHRPDWLEGLELDIWLPGQRLAIEYQGQQHYKAVKAWGGEKALVALQGRDARKRAICAQHGVALLEIAYTEPLTRRHIAQRIREHGAQLASIFRE